MAPEKSNRLTILYIAISVIMVLGTVLPLALPQNQQNTISGNGTVTFVNQQGGFYGVIADTGINYDPINMDRNLEQDGLRVEIQGTVRSDVVNTHQWGTMLQLTNIEKLP